MYSDTMGLVVKFKKLHDGAMMPSQSYHGDVGSDLYVCEDILIPHHSFVDVPIGIAIALPIGYWARITGRSSTIRKWGIQVQEGIIDNGYRGPLFVGVQNLGREVEVPRGSRLAQLIVKKIERVTWIEEAELPKSVRGDRGFGSSGR